MGADSEQGKKLKEMAERCVFDCKNAYDGDSIAKRIVQALEEAFQGGVESVTKENEQLREGIRMIIALCSPGPQGNHHRLHKIFGRLMDIAEPLLHPVEYAEAPASLTLQGRKQEK